MLNTVIYFTPEQIRQVRKNANMSICHCPTCRQINKMIQALEHKKQLLVDYRKCVHSGLPGPVPWRE